MTVLSPKLASSAAYLPYQLVSHSGALRVEPHLDKHFSFDRTTRSYEGKTGGFFGIGATTAGFAVIGLGKGKYKDDLVISVRGTKQKNDWVTNLNLGVKGSPNGAIGHAGFINTFHTLRPKVKSFLLSQKKLPKRIHCVGHSLGGALASLFADWLRAELSMRVNLYTFGAPRVGHQMYARKSEHANDKIFRCTHGADPVPMIPLWPFQHAPYSGTEYRLDNSSGIDVGTHGMGPNDSPGYVNTARSESWTSLNVRSNHFLNKPVRLKFENRNQATFTEYWADKLSAALTTLLKDAGYFTAISMQANISSGLTFYDKLAQCIEKVAAVSEKLADQTKGLLGHMLAFVGRSVTKITNLTAKYIRWVFDVTLKKLYNAAHRAIDSLD
ncbi:lipase family protein [Vibrio sp. S9_S30]|uniref:lipase family protein n=1 Tax=Vibrio sp. S9_S30 TaxID=2720226 RepID=UPI0016802C22|nr:lipase family protein [Vibrio sp. S9_S30]MBD1555525.1 lipase family protein [Vibrio sp. S9_S30]